MLLIVVASLLIVAAPLFLVLILGVTAITAHFQTTKLNSDENSDEKAKID